MATAMTEAEKLSKKELAKIRADFPVLSQEIYGKPLAYLDNGATTQKPQCVIDCVNQFLAEDYGTVRRGVYYLSEKSTRLYDDARKKLSVFINAASEKEVVITKGTTESINLVAATYGRMVVGVGDDVIISAIEHHANIVPWQQLCLEKGANLKVIPVDDAGELILEEYEKLLSPTPRIVAVNHVSTALGTVNPVQKMAESAHKVGAVILVDGAQSVPHMPVDVQALGADFYAGSAHKTYSLTGVGFLYGRYDLLDKMPPYQTGGDMIMSVTFEKTTFAKPPNKFEAGTPPIAGVVAFSTALDYLSDIGMDRIEAYELSLLKKATEKLSAIPQVKIIGNAKEKAAIISFVIEGVHPHDIGTVLDREGVAIRAGHHCAQPTMERFGVPATARASFSFYNNEDDIDALVHGVETVIKLFA